MKTKLLVALFLLTTMHSFSQAYVPFQFGNTRWKNAYYNFGPIKKDFCYFSTDTVGITVNNKKYYPIERSVSPIPLGGNIQAYLRDDTIAKKVFVLNTVDSSENILYDFSVQLGDTVRGIKFNSSICGIFPLYLDTIKIDSVVVRNYNGTNRRLFVGKSIANTSNNPNAVSLQYQYIEGIGSIQDLLDPKPFPWTDPSFFMDCYTYNSINYYGDSWSCSNFATAVKDLEFQNAFSLTTTHNIFTITHQTNEPFTWQVFNRLGAIILQGNSHEINLQNYSTGMYFLQIKTKNGSYTLKLMVE